MAILSNTLKAINALLFSSENTNSVETEPQLNAGADEVIDNEQPYACIATDVTDEGLMMEIMRLGYDPANYNKDQMLKIMFNSMNQNRPVTVPVDEPKMSNSKIQQQ